MTEGILEICVIPSGFLDLVRHVRTHRAQTNDINRHPSSIFRHHPPAGERGVRQIA